MTVGFRVREATPVDVPAMARVHVETWRETYRGVMSDEVLDDPELLGRRNEHRDAPRHLHLLYVSAAFHGAGVGARLLDLVIESSAPATLWVADRNLRARAFYRKQRFLADGGQRSEGGVRELRMTRT